MTTTCLIPTTTTVVEPLAGAARCECPQWAKHGCGQRPTAQHQLHEGNDDGPSLMPSTTPLIAPRAHGKLTTPSTNQHELTASPHPPTFVATSPGRTRVLMPALPPQASAMTNIFGRHPRSHHHRHLPCCTSLFQWRAHCARHVINYPNA